MIEDNANGSKFHGVYFRNGLSGGTFGHGIRVDNDQAADIQGFDTETGSPALRCDATFCGSAIYAPGPFSTNAALAWIHESNFFHGLRQGGN